MSRTSGYRLSAMIFGLALCLILPACRTYTETGCDAKKVSTSSDKIQEVIGELKAIMIPEMTFYAPATIVDAVEFFKKASREHAKPGTPLELRGVSFDLRLPSFVPIQSNREGADPFAVAVSTNCAPPRLAAISVRAISLFDAIQLVCEVTDMKWRIQQNGTVRLFSKWSELDEDAITRTYTVPQTLADSLLNTPNDQSSEADADKSCFMTTDQPSDVAADKAWKAFFKQLGVTEPKWTQFNYLPVIGKLRVTSTKKNLAIIDNIFDLFALHMVEVEMQIHAFRSADVERLRLSGGMSLEPLMALRQKGKARQVASSTALTKSGQEALVKAVQEVIYPTGLNMNAGPTGSNVAVRSVANALMPGNFSMRETGMILQVVPEVMHNCKHINLTLKPQWVTLDGWESYPAAMASGWTHTTLSIKQPIFGVTSFETQTSVKDGETVLLGSCSTQDGEWVQVGFLTARLRDVQPLYAGGCMDKAKLQNELKDEAVRRKMKMIEIPEARWNPSYTIIDAIRCLKDASIQYDDPGIPKTERGVSFVVKLPASFWDQKRSFTNADIFAEPESETNGVPHIPPMGLGNNTLYDTLKLICDVTGMESRIRDGIVWIMPAGDHDDELITRIYPVLPTLCERISTDANNREGEKVWKAFFEQMGVTWPVGSSVSYLESIRMLRITNTPQNLDVFEQIFEDLEITPRMVEVDAQIHAFRPEDIEQVRLSGDMSVEALMTLRKNGRAKPVASATVLSSPQQEAIIKSVREVLYPSELLMDCGQSGSNIMSRSVANALMPANFTMREAGMTLQVVPEISSTDQSQINVLLKPQWVTLEGWQSYPAKRAEGWTHNTLSFKQPVFGTTSFETQVTVKTGETVLLGSSSTPDGKWVHVGFLTVKECR